MKTISLLFVSFVFSIVTMAQNSWTLSNSGFEEGFCVNNFVVTKSNTIIATGTKTVTEPIYKSIPALYKSGDNGINWTLIDTFTYHSCQSIQRICAVGDTLLMYAFPAIYKSGDDGNSWIQINPFLFDYNEYIDFAVIKPNKILIACWIQMCCPTLNYPAIYETTDFCKSFSMLKTNGLGSDYNDRIHYNAIGSIEDTLILGVTVNKYGDNFNEISDFNIYRSVDGGILWKLSNQTIAGYKVTGFAVTESKIAYAMGVKGSTPMIYKSADNGNTWKSVDLRGLENHNYAFHGIGAKGNTILLSGENNNKEYAVYRFEDKTGVSDFTSVGDFKVYPNRVSQFITIGNEPVTSRKITGVDIISINGIVVRSFSFGFKRFDVSGLLPGIYIVDIKTTERNYRDRIIKMN